MAAEAGGADRDHAVSRPARCRSHGRRRQAAGDGGHLQRASGLREPVRGLPQGTVTFLLPTWRSRRAGGRRTRRRCAMRLPAMTRSCVGRSKLPAGVVFSTMGSGLAAVFASARQAVRAVLAAQQGLAALAP